MEGRLSFIVSLLFSGFLADFLVGFCMRFVYCACGCHIAFGVYFVKLADGAAVHFFSLLFL